METERLIKLVEQAQQGNRNALEELYIDAYNTIYRLALRILKNPEDAEDIAQEVFITVQQRISGLREPTAFYAWANQITANKCNRFFNRHKGLIKSDDEEIILSIVDEDPEHMPDKALDNEATRKIIMEVIDNLPDNQRMCTLLFYYGQLTIADIAVALETNENTVKSRLSLARAKIRAALEEKAEKEGIKLWGAPLALTPIVREAMENMDIPLEVQARIQESISEYANQNPNGANANLGAENVIADSAANVAATTAKTSSAFLSTKAIIAIVCGVVLILAVSAVAIYWPQISNMFSPTAYTPDIGEEPDYAPEDDILDIGEEVDYTPEMVALPQEEAQPEEAEVEIVAVGSVIEFGGFDWLVLDMQDDRMLIITKDIIAMRQYHEFDERYWRGQSVMSITWAESDIRQYLNNEFFNRFSAEDMARIMETTVVTYDNPWFGTSGGADTTDRIFLLSLEEVLQYFGDSGQIQDGPTQIPLSPYAPDLAIGWEFGITDEYDEARVARIGAEAGTEHTWWSEGQAVLWWLRSPGYHVANAASVTGNGGLSVVGVHVQLEGSDWTHAYYGVRPAMWISIG